MVIYTIFKIALMAYRMYRGYSRGAKGYNTVEPKHLQDKIKYLYLYLEFLDKRIYETLGDKYNVAIYEKAVDYSGERVENCDLTGERVGEDSAG